MYTWEGYAGNQSNLFTSRILRDYTRNIFSIDTKDDDIVRPYMKVYGVNENNPTPILYLLRKQK